MRLLEQRQHVLGITSLPRPPPTPANHVFVPDTMAVVGRCLNQENLKVSSCDYRRAKRCTMFRRGAWI